MTRLFALFALMLAFSPAQASVVYYLASAPENEIRSVQTDGKRLANFLYSSGQDRLYVDKMWHGLHWLLARSPGTTKDPASKVMLGGTEVGQDLGYGKARFFSPSEVKAIAALLSSLKEKDLRKNYLPKMMDAAHIYPDDWVVWEKDGDDPWGMLMTVFKDLVSFYQHAAQSGHAVIYAWG